MKKKLADSIRTYPAVSYSLLVMLIFIAGMRFPHPIKKAAGMSYTYLALGDSYTIGEQVDPRLNFPSQVTASLRKHGFDFSPPEIIAKTGWTTDELADAIKNAALKPSYDFVTLLIGVNNQYRGRKVEEYIPEFESLLKQAIHFAGNKADHVIVLSIPDWGVTPFARDRNRVRVASEINAYNAANKLMATRYKVHYIDITPWTREAATDHSLLACDSLHPSDKEYKRWAAEIVRKITLLLPKR